MKSKKELRKEILQLRDVLTDEARREKSHSIAEQVIEKNVFIEADKILLFASYHSEVDTTEIFEAARGAGKDVFYPKIIGKEMEFFKIESEEELIEGYRGIREPEANPQKQFRPVLTDKICVIMPGAVFDKAGNRIGYGGGYYDKFLQRLEEVWVNSDIVRQEHIYKMAIAFECQMVKKGQIGNDVHDIKADCIVTEECTYN